METQQLSPDLLGVIEEVLALKSPFADSAYIFERLQVSLKGRLRSISQRLPVAGALLDEIEETNGSLHRVLGDTVVRCAIIHAHNHVETNSNYGLSLAECERIFESTLRHLQQGNRDTQLNDGSLRRLGPEPYQGWIWSDEHSDDIFGKSFRFLLRDRYAAVPVTPTEDEIMLLQQGTLLLQDLLPTLTPSTLAHAQMIALVPNEGGWKGCASSSQFHLGGTIFLGRSLHTPWWVAEHVLHEALHQKLYDFRQAHSLLEFDYARPDAPRVISPWNSEQLNKGNRWDVHRVYAAFHVYVHLAHLALVAEQRAPELEDTYGPFRAMMGSRKALERAHYLAEKMREQCWDELGLGGKNMAEWLFSVLEILDPAAPPKGAVIHLCLDLYETEANRVASALQAGESTPSDLPQRLIPLAKDELESARQVLSAINAQQALQQLDSDASEYTEAELGTNFPQLRRHIGMALMSASFDRYRLTETGDQDQLLRQMVENASRQVFAALAGLPPAVADAKRRAHDLQFNMSCDDNVGRMLAMLASSVIPGGRILEIGTGVGVGIAWITEGLNGRSDVEVITIENQTRLIKAMDEWQRPPYIHVLATDAMQALGSIGTFDLVFADASPVKYENIERILQVLRPGGILVIDDLGEPNSTERQRNNKNALRRVLLQSPEFRVVDMPTWSTGVVLATKCRNALQSAVNGQYEHAAAGTLTT